MKRRNKPFNFKVKEKVKQEMKVQLASSLDILPKKEEETKSKKSEESKGSIDWEQEISQPELVQEEYINKYVEEIKDYYSKDHIEKTENSDDSENSDSSDFKVNKSNKDIVDEEDGRH